MSAQGSIAQGVGIIVFSAIFRPNGQGVQGLLRPRMGRSRRSIFSKMVQPSFRSPRVRNTTTAGITSFLSRFRGNQLEV